VRASGGTSSYAQPQASQLELGKGPGGSCLFRLRPSVLLVPTVLLVRHAQASFGTGDYDVLSPDGVKQAEELAAEIARRELRVDRLISGSLARQRETVAPLAALTGAPVSIDPRWNEYDADDILARYSESTFRLVHQSTGASRATTHEFQVVLEQALHSWITLTEQAQPTELWRAFYERANAALDHIVGELDRGQTALVCTSGGVLAAICIRLLGAPDQSFVRFNRVTVNAGISKVIHGGRGTTMVSFNEHGHLEKPGGSLVTYR
jgi:broad specificity phosphatase PhoE